MISHDSITVIIIRIHDCLYFMQQNYRKNRNPDVAGIPLRGNALRRRWDSWHFVQRLSTNGKRLHRRFDSDYFLRRFRNKMECCKARCRTSYPAFYCWGLSHCGSSRRLLSHRAARWTTGKFADWLCHQFYGCRFCLFHFACKKAELEIRHSISARS